jgi:hypothetical protein
VAKAAKVVGVLRCAEETKKTVEADTPGLSCEVHQDSEEEECPGPIDQLTAIVIKDNY